MIAPKPPIKVPHFLSRPYSEYQEWGSFDEKNRFTQHPEYNAEEIKFVIYPDVFFKNLKHDKRYDVWIGGNGSGKSTNKAKQLLYKALDGSKYFRCLFIRHNHSDIKKSMYRMFKDVAEMEGIAKYFKFCDGSYDILCLPTQNVMYSAGLDDTGKLSGVQEISDIWFEEPITIAKGRKLVMLDKEQFDDLNTRLRTPLAKHRIHLTLNPINKGFFIYENLLDPQIKKENILYDINDFNICYSNYLDNPFLPEEYVQKVILNFKGNRAIYGRTGEWPDEKTGGEWLPAFDKSKHVKSVPYVVGSPVHEGHDFNLLPYQTGIFSQIVRSKKDNRLKVRVFKEYCLEPPLNVPEYITKNFILDYLEPFGYNTMFIYGDASGRYGTDAFRPIFSEAAHYLANDSDQVMKRNPYVATARDLINDLLEGKHGIDIEIDRGCTNLIKDLSTLQTAPDGFDCERVNGVETKGHCYSALVYILAKVFSHLLKENTKI